MEESLIKRLVASVQCSICGKRYEADNIDVLDHEEDLWFLRVTCPACDTHFLLAAIIKEEKVTEVITDLTEAELDKFKNAGDLTPDEILDMHNFLKGFDGDFSRLFAQKQVR